MARKWTQEQQAAISMHGCNLLVSAAAGSGKTAVLVERVLRMLTDPEHPVDIDRILIVTFTRAAASEMKERLRQAIEDLIGSGNGTEHLKRQIALLPHSFIMTIDSFCSYVVHNYCHFLDLDPDFRIGELPELTLLRGDVLKELLEGQYEAGDEAFLRFVEMYGGDREDTALEDYILRLYDFSQSNPWPGEWLEECRRQLTWDSPQMGGQGPCRQDPGKNGKTPGSALPEPGDPSGPDGLECLGWVRCILQDVRRSVSEVKVLLETGLELCGEADGPWMYREMFLGDLDIAEGLLKAETYEKLYGLMRDMKFARRTTKKDGNVDEEKKTRAAGIRDQAKKVLQDLKKQYFIQSPEEIGETMSALQEPLCTLIELTEEFALRFQAAKAEKNILDFQDLEHGALDILVTPGDGVHERTEAARELCHYFEEIMIDEYQDSSLLQEVILGSISGQWEGRPNQFMVGDVKQSIYSFRMAKPELFIEKYTSFTRPEGVGYGMPSGYTSFSRPEGIGYGMPSGDTSFTRPEIFGRGAENSFKIDLHANFRSRGEVLESVNEVFYQLMGADLGGIDYNEEAALNPAADFPLPERGEDVKTELILVDGEQEVYGEEEYHVRELEGKAIAARIRQLTDENTGMRISDGKGGKRTVQYRDIVVLLRSMGGWAQALTEALEDAGIPSYSETSTGYFSAWEVQLVLSLLKVIDNPRQDIPLAAVLSSPIGSFSPEEMARLVGGKKKKQPPRGLYGALKAYSEGRDAEEGKDAEGQKNALGEKDAGGKEAVFGEKDPLRKKAADFLGRLEGYREAAGYMKVHQLLLYVLEDTGYGAYAAAMPGGEGRKANLDMLVSYALQFEKTIYHGLFQFVRYIENMRQYEVDFGLASVFSEQDNIVKLTTIHKSKGLEYPVVILAGAGKRFNQQDAREKIVIHPVYGVAADQIDLERRLKIPSLMKKVLARQIVLEQMGEELRILYVAMTRAKEKLIITGGDNHLENRLKKWEGLGSWERKYLPASILAQASSFLDWLLMCRVREGENTGIRLVRRDTAGIVGAEVARQFGLRCRKEDLLAFLSGEKEEIPGLRAGEREEMEKAMESLGRYLSFTYPGQRETEIYSKLSVSELKERREDDGQPLYGEPLSDALEGSAGEDGGKKESMDGIRAEWKEGCGGKGEIPEELEGTAGLKETAKLEEAARKVEEAELPGFMRDRRSETPTALGTLYHRVAEHMDFVSVRSLSQVNSFLESLVGRGIATAEERKRISGWKWKTLLDSPLGRRMGRAQAEGKLYREKSFMMGLPANMLRENWDSGELVLVQGIVDAWFIEDGHIVIVDYKTDKADSEKTLIDHYGKQLYYYKEALERAVGMPVKECVIYSFYLEKAIVVRESSKAEEFQNKG